MTPDADLHDPSGAVLVICTGNICRSPYLERVLQLQLAGTGFSVASAGTGALVEAPIDPESAKRLAAVGADPHNFSARQVTRQMVASADLVLCATREHVSAVVPLHPPALRYTFALHDLADLLATVAESDVAKAPGGNRAARVAAAAAPKRATVRMRASHESGIVDPYLRDPHVFDQMVTEINGSLPMIVATLRG